MAYKKTPPIDESQLENLAKRQWSKVQIAAHFGVSVDTLDRKYAAKIEESRQRGTASILDMVWEAASSRKDWRAIQHLAEHFCGHHKKQLIEGKVETKNEAQDKLADALTEQIQGQLSKLLKNN